MPGHYGRRRLRGLGTKLPPFGSFVACPRNSSPTQATHFLAAPVAINLALAARSLPTNIARHSKIRVNSSILLRRFSLNARQNTPQNIEEIDTWARPSDMRTTRN